MGRFSQVGRPLTITTALDDDPLLLVGLQGCEGVSELFRFNLDLRADGDAHIPFEKLVGQPASVTLTGPGRVARNIHGLIREFTQADQDDDFAHYRAQLVPKFWLWTRRIQSRIFQQQSVKEVLRHILTGLDVAIELHGEYPSRNYCVQYQESDFAFASRLMEEEGISYFFRHSAEGHQLVLTDRALHHPEIAAPGRVTYNPRKDAPVDMPLVRRFARTQAVGIGVYTVRDYHYELPDKKLEESEKARESIEVGRNRHVLKFDDLEVFDYPAGHAPQFTGIGPDGQAKPGLREAFRRGEQLARIRMESETAASLTVRGEGNAVSLLPGHVFRMDRHPDGDLPYLLLRVEHEVRVEGTYRSGDGLKLEYRNRFEGQPAALAYRPQRKTPRPIIAGPQTAVVVGLPDSTQPYLDRLGRVKVQFHWDRQGKRDSGRSCWIRVSQVWAGPGWGAFFWPRPGHEVVVAFEGGDPDRPLIVGSVYNEVNQPPTNPQAVPEVAGFQSCSIDGDANTEFNALLFSDKPGEERVHIHSQKDTIQTSESTQFAVSREPAVEYFRSFTLLGGSGSGGGSEVRHVSPGESLANTARGAGRLVQPFAWNAFTRARQIPAHQVYRFGPHISATLAGRAYTENIGIPGVNFEFDIAVAFTQTTGATKAVLTGIAGALLVAAADVPTIALALAAPLAMGTIDMAFAQRVQQTYFGPIFDIARCKSYRFHGQPLFGEPELDVRRLDSSVVDKKRPAAKALALALLTLRTTLGIVNQVVNKPGQTTNEAWNITQGLLNGFVAELLQCLLLQLELTSAMAQTALDDTLRGKRAVGRAAFYEEVKTLNEIPWYRVTEEALQRAKRNAELAADDASNALKLGTGQAIGAATIDQTQHTYGEFTLRGTTGVTVETPRFDVYAHASEYPGSICLAAPDGRADITAQDIALVAGSPGRPNSTLHAGGQSVRLFHRPSVLQRRNIRLDENSLILSCGVFPFLNKVSLELKEDRLVATCGLNSITLTDDAITLSCGLSKIELTPTGVAIRAPNVDAKGDLTMNLDALQLETKAGALKKSSAAVDLFG